VAVISGAIATFRELLTLDMLHDVLIVPRKYDDCIFAFELGNKRLLWPYS
jgi:hypothetical protein